MFLTWVDGREEAMLGPRLPRTPPPTGPFRAPMNLLETTAIQYSTPEFWIGALLFAVGTVVVFYSCWGVASQVMGYMAFLHAYATASWVSPIASSGVGPKLALISILLCSTSVVFPYWIGPGVGKGRFVNRFLNFDPGGQTRLALPSGLMLAGGCVAVLSMVAAYSDLGGSIGEDASSTASLMFAAAALILIALAFVRLVWDSQPAPPIAERKAEEDEFAWVRQLMARRKAIAAIAVVAAVILAALVYAYRADTCELTITVVNGDPDRACQVGVFVNGALEVNSTLESGKDLTAVLAVKPGWYTVEVDYVWLNGSVVKGLGSSADFSESTQLMPFGEDSMAYTIPESSGP